VRYADPVVREDAVAGSRIQHNTLGETVRDTRPASREPQLSSLPCSCMGTATGTRWIAQPQADGDLAETGASDRRPSGSGLEKLAVHESEFVEDEIDAEGPFVDAAAQQRLGSACRSAVGVMVASGRGHSLARPAWRTRLCWSQPEDPFREGN
jgi:hypothetical protein